MNTEKITELKNKFEEAAQEIEGVEFWYARDLQKLLEYDEWRNFNKVIGKAIQLVENGMFKATFEFYEKEIELPRGAKRKIRDYRVNRNGVNLLTNLSSKNKLSNLRCPRFITQK